MSILECILIDASSGEIKLTGNDMELGIETTVNGEILEHGKIALDAKLFSEITRRVSSQNAVVTIESDDKFNTTISCENSVFNIQGRDGDEFSYIPYISFLPLWMHCHLYWVTVSTGTAQVHGMITFI